MKTQPAKLSASEPLLQALNYFHPLSTDISDFLKKHTYSLFVKKKKLLLKSGLVCKHLYFIRKGAIRGFVRQGAKEVTTWITVENEIVTSIAGLNVQQPSREYIQCIEDCELIVLSMADLKMLYEKFPEFNIIGRKLLQQYYMDAENRAFISRVSKADQRYQHFLEAQPHLANRIPLSYIASYLGITPETLSIVRKNSMKPGNPG